MGRLLHRRPCRSEGHRSNSAGIPGAPEAGIGSARRSLSGYRWHVQPSGCCRWGSVRGSRLRHSAITNAGAIVIINDLYTGVVAGQAFDQNTSGVPGTPENNDSLGQALDIVRAGNTTHLAVGIPLEDIGSAADAGSVQLFTSTGSTITPGVGLTQDITNVGDTSEAGDQFGRRIVLAPPGLSDTKTRLAVSAPFEDGTPGADSGLVQIFPLDDLGAETTHDQTTAGGAATANDRFGEGLGFVAGAAERSILVGAPDDAAFTSGIVSVIPLPVDPPGPGVPVRVGCRPAGRIASVALPAGRCSSRSAPDHQPNDQAQGQGCLIKYRSSNRANHQGGRPRSRTGCGREGGRRR